MSLAHRLYEQIATKIPPKAAGAIDWRRPAYLTSWGGPLNGQHHRQQIVRELTRAVAFDLVIETGTFRGTSTEFFTAVSGAPVETVEASPRFYEYSRRRLDGMPNVTLHLGDSRSFLRSQATKHPDAAALIYLDAHWEKDLPLAKELDIISKFWTRSVVLIDDFEVPGDPGYKFDNYGPGMAITAS